MEQPLTTLLCKEPPPLSGSREAADNFCLIVRKHDETRGSLDVRKRLTIFAEKNEGTEFFSGNGKTCKDLFSRQKPTASPTGKPGTRVEYKAAF